MKKDRVVVMGGGISGLSAAALLAQGGLEVILLEKNSRLGGRARNFTADGFTFDMGPSWYWMPEVFERFYQRFGYTTSDFYALHRLDPSYRIYWEDGSKDDIPADLDELMMWFENKESGSSGKLEQFLKEAKYKYEVGMNDLVYKPGKSWFEFMDVRVLRGFFNLHLLSSFSKYIRKYFKHPKLLSLLEFPVLFLGAMPKDTPALYSLMNYADLKLGTWYPEGGMYKLVEAFEQIAREQGVQLYTDHEVISIRTENGSVKGVQTATTFFECDYLVSGADYKHTEDLLKEHANYNDAYWEERTMAPSCLLYYLGVDKKIPQLQHHNLFFDAPFEQHALEIYKTPKWPSKPLFYACVPSKTDTTVAPVGMENLFLLIPVAPNLNEADNTVDLYFDRLMDRLEQHTGESIRQHVVYKKSYSISDFKTDYHAFKGNAYGLANTLKQTAVWKPKMKNGKLKNCFYTGQLTVPGPGLPPAVVSGEVVANQVLELHRKTTK